MKNKLSQKEKVLSYIRTYGYITSFDAYNSLHITQLGARIDELQNEGYIFTKTPRKGKDIFGSPTHWIEYSLAKEEKA